MPFVYIFVDNEKIAIRDPRNPNIVIQCRTRTELERSSWWYVHHGPLAAFREHQSLGMVFCRSLGRGLDTDFG